MAYLLLFDPARLRPLIAFRHNQFSDRDMRVRLEGMFPPNMGWPLARSGEPFDPALLPDHVRVRTPDNADIAPADCNIFSGPGFNLVVNVRVRRAIEEAGGDHVRFHPIDLVDQMAGGDPIPGQWFFIVFEDVFNPVIEERSSLLKLFANGRSTAIPETAAEARLICRRADVAGRGFWTGEATAFRPQGHGRTPHYAALPTFTYCSDSVHDALVEAGLMDFDWVVPIEEVDDPETVPLTPGLTGEPVGIVHSANVHVLERARAEGDYSPFFKSLYGGDPWPGGPVRLDAGSGSIPDLYYHNALLVVSAAAREAIEDLEPDMHRFEPVEFFSSFDPYQTANQDTQHFVMVIGEPMPEPTIAEMSSGVGTFMTHGFGPAYRGLAEGEDGRNVFDAEKCGDRHLWSRVPDPNSLSTRIYLSEPMMARLNTLNVAMSPVTSIPIYERPTP